MQLTEKEEKARKMVCLPLDNIESILDAEERINELSPVVGLFKIGYGSFTRFGHEITQIVKKNNSELFLDLKYKDIPNTVKDAAKAAAEQEVYLFNVHADGGSEMMKAAVKGINEAEKDYGIRRPKIIGVTVLTSIDQKILNEELKIPGKIEEYVLHLAKLSYNSGLDGIVCSARELYAIKDKLPKDFMYVTPGIKGPNTPPGEDQKRVFTPGKAVQDGSSILVVGRAITGPKTSEGRLEAGYQVLGDISRYL